MDCEKRIYAAGDDWYMVTDYTWLIANPKDSGLLCIPCLEKRLKRKLDFDDLILCHANIENTYTRKIIKKVILNYEAKLKKGGMELASLSLIPKRTVKQNTKIDLRGKKNTKKFIHFLKACGLLD